MNLLSPFPGKLIVELTSADPEATLQAISSQGINLLRIQMKTDLTYLFSIFPRDYSLLSHICEKQGSSLKITGKKGLYWTVKQMRHRKFLFLGLAVFLFFSLLLPTRVFFLHVQGNVTIPSRQILSVAQDCGIGFGASRKLVRSEKVKNKLLSAMPQLQWVGVNTVGCVATISVRERVQKVQTEVKPISSIVADRDGYLLSVTVNSGNSLCKPGQYVVEGQLLVSGYTDCGIYIRATPSEAEILAQTIRHMKTITPSEIYFRGRMSGKIKKYSLLIGKKRINLMKGSGILDTTCDRIYEEKYATLPGGFQLPLALCIEEFRFYDSKIASIAQEDAGSALSSFASDYLRQQMVAGTVLSKEERLSSYDGLICLEGEYTCQEIIGKVQENQIGEYHAQNN